MFKVYTVNGQEYEVSNEKESKFLQEFPDAELIEDTISTPTETVTSAEVVPSSGMLPASTQRASGEPSPTFEGDTPSIAPAVRAEEGFWSELYQSVNQYWTAAGNTEETLDIAFGDVTEEDLEEYQKALEKEDSMGGPTQSMLDFYKSMEDNGGGLLGGFKAFWEHPEVGLQQGIGSMAGLFRTGLETIGGEKTSATVAGGTATGAGIGAGIGLATGAISGPGAVLTTGAGAIAGATRGAYGSLSGLMEGTGKISELMREHLKGDYSTENIRKVLDNDAVMSDIRSKAIARGLTIAAVDGITGGLGKAVGKVTKKATFWGVNPAQVGVEALGGAGGEALAQQAAGEEYDAGAIILEAASGPSTLPGEAGLNAIQRLRKAKKDGTARLEDSPKKEIKDGPSAYRINGQPIKKEAFIETINKMNPEDVKDADISVSNDPDTNKYISDIVRNVYENEGKKKPPSGGGAGVFGEKIKEASRDYNAERFELLSEEDKMLANRIKDETKRNKFVNSRTSKTTEGNDINEAEAAEKALADPQSDEATLIAAARKMDDPLAPFNDAAISSVSRNLAELEERGGRDISRNEVELQRTLKYKNQLSKPKTKGTDTTMDLKARDKESKRIQPTFMDKAQDKYIKKIGDLQNQLEDVILEGAPPEIEETLREQIAYQEDLLRKSKNEVNKEVNLLNPNEKTELNELKSQQRLYQSFVNNEKAPDEVKKIAKEKLNEIENKQLEVFFGPSNRSIEASQKAQQIFENEGIEAYDKIIDTQEGLIRQIAIDKLNKVPQNKRVEGDLEALVSELKYGKEGAIGIIQKYDSAKNPSISSHIGQILKRRVHRAAKKIVPQLDSKDFSAPEVANVIADETGMVEPTFGPKVLADMLQLPAKLINKATKAVPAALQNVIKSLTGDKGKTLNKKKRISLAEKSIADIIEGRVLPEIKKEFGKNTKNKKDFDNYLNKNWVPLTRAFLGQKSITKGEGVAKDWSMFPPSQEQVKDYFNGSDIVVGEISKKTGKPITEGQKSRAVADRKASLAEAVSKQFALELQEEYLAQNPKERKAINKEINEGVDENNIIMLKANDVLDNSPNIKEDNKKDLKKALDRTMSREELESLTEKLLQDPAKTIAELNGITEADAKKLLSSYRGQNKENSAITKQFIIDKVLPYFGPEIASLIKGSFSMGSFSRAQFSADKYGDGLGPIIEKLGPIKERKYKKSNITKTPVRPAYRPKGPKPLSYKAQAQTLVNDTKKALKRIFTKDYQNEIDSKEKLLKELVLGLNELYKDNPTPETRLAIAAILATQSEGMTHFIRTLSPFRYFPNPDLLSVNDVAWYDGRTLVGIGLDKKGNPNLFEGVDKSKIEKFTPKLIEEEHSFKAGKTANAIFNMIMNGTAETDIDAVIEGMAQTALLIKDNETLNTTPGLKSGMPKGFHLFSALGNYETISIYAEANGKFGPIDLNKYFTYGKKLTTVAEGLNAASGNTVDQIAASNKVIAENSEKDLQLVAKAKEDKFNSKEKIELTETETADAFFDILQGNWNRDGSTSIEVFTNPDAMAEVLMNEFGKTELEAKVDVQHFGFRIGNKIFINLKAKQGLETGVHEAGHVWNSVVHKAAPEVWNGIMSRVKESGLWDTYLAQVKSNKFYNDIVQQYEDGSNVFNLENEIFARILEDYGGKKVKSEGSTINKIKEVIKKYFNELAKVLGFDPTTKNFGDLTVNEMIDLAVSEVITGDPLANFSKLKDSKDKSWFRKTKANIDPSFKASIDPEYQGLNKLNEIYKSNGRNLGQAIKDSYNEVKDIMSLEQWVDFVMNTVGETQIGKTPAEKALVFAKEDAINAEKLRQKKISILKENNLFEENDQYLTSEQLNKKLKEIDSSIRKEQKEKNKAEGLNKKFRQVLNSVTGTWGKPSKWFVPPSAEDIKGLLYAFLPGGKAGVAAKKFFKSALLDPYYKGVAAAEAEILQRTKQFSKLLKDSGIDLNKNVEGTPYAVGQAIKVYNWVKQGINVDVKKSEYIQALVDAVENNPDLKAFAEQIENGFPIEYHAEWRNDSFNKSIYQEINTGTRRKHLEVFSNNVDLVFDKDNLQEIENKYGKKFRQTLENTLRRMKTGRNRVSTDSQSNAFLNWVNRAVATTMFVNTRSAMLQLLSSLNFIGKPNNNIFQATGALFSGSWRKDFNTLWNSDYLKARRDGAKFDVLADEIAEKGEKGLNKLLKWGFLPTRMADSFAIALGGSAFYGNTVKALMKDGMSEADAKKAAMQQWIEAAEESQQSADPSKISEIQASNTGKLIYAFANTPFQYIRKQKRHLQDVVSGRSYAQGGMNQVRTDLQSVLYYSIGQAMMFNALQSALFAVGWEDDEEKRKALLDDKEALIIERALTSYMKSMGNPGAITAALYSMVAEGSEQIQKKGRIDNAYKLALEATSISPPLNAKLKDVVAIGNIYKYNYKEIQENPLKPSINNPTFEIAGNAASFVGVPLDRVIRKAQNLSAIANEETEAWQKVFQTLGWNEWDFYSPTYEAQQRTKQKKTKKRLDSFLTPKQRRMRDYQQMSPEQRKAYAKKRLSKGQPLFKKEGKVKILGKAHKDGTIEIAPELSPEKRRKVEAHENKHKQDMQAGKLDYSKDWVRYGNKHYKRTPDKKVVYNGKKYIEGHPTLPWEKAANQVERQVT